MTPRHRRCLDGLHFGKKLKRVSIESGEARTDWIDDGKRNSADECATAVAGIMGEILHEDLTAAFGEPLLRQVLERLSGEASGKIDRDELERICEASGDKFGKALGVAVKESLVVLSEKRSELARLIEALAKRGQLSGDEVLAILSLSDGRE